MSIKSLKNLIFSFTDFEFLGSINLVDFERKKIDIKRSFYNRLIGCIKENVQIKTRSQLQILVNNIKELYLQRLAFVSTTSFFKYFFKNIKIAFQSFSRRLNRYFEDGNILSTTQPKQKKKRSRKNKKVVEIVPVQPETTTEQTPKETETDESETESDNSDTSQDELHVSTFPLPEFSDEEEFDAFGRPLFSESEEDTQSEIDDNGSNLESVTDDLTPSEHESILSQDESEECYSGVGEADAMI
jgi:hypothetical protein